LLNRSYAELGSYYGVLIDPARALKPNGLRIVSGPPSVVLDDRRKGIPM
jgi:hypothetical protein